MLYINNQEYKSVLINDILNFKGSEERFNKESLEQKEVKTLETIYGVLRYMYTEEHYHKGGNQ